MKEVKARVKAVLRRATLQEKISEANEKTENTLRFKGLVINLDTKTAILNDRPIQLTKLELELLRLFLQHPNVVFRREDLLGICWPHDVMVMDRTVDVSITRLRKKIGPYGKNLKTRIGYGYFFEK